MDLSYQNQKFIQQTSRFQYSLQMTRMAAELLITYMPIITCIAQAASRQPLTPEAEVRSQASLWQICSTCAGFRRVLRFYLVRIIPSVLHVQSYTTDVAYSLKIAVSLKTLLSIKCNVMRLSHCNATSKSRGALSFHTRCSDDRTTARYEYLLQMCHCLIQTHRIIVTRVMRLENIKQVEKQINTKK